MEQPVCAAASLPHESIRRWVSLLPSCPLGQFHSSVLDPGRSFLLWIMLLSSQGIIHNGEAESSILTVHIMSSIMPHLISSKVLYVQLAQEQDGSQ